MLEAFRRRRVLRRYRTKLGPYLAKRYGKHPRYYTPDQVSEGVVTLGLDASLLSYAVAMYSRRESFEQYQQTIEHSYSYDTIQDELMELGADWLGDAFDIFDFDSSDGGGTDGGAADGD